MSRRPGLRVVTREGTTALYLRGTVRGQRVYESAGTDDPALAEEARSAREAELYRAAVHGARERKTFSVAALDYLSHEPRGAATRTAVGKLLRHFGPGTTCDQIDQSRVDRAARALCRPGASPATKLRQVITPTKAILNHAARRGWCDAPTFEKVRGGGRRTDWMTPAEAEAHVQAAAKHLKPLLIFLYCTGARLGEAIELDWNQVDLQHGRAVLRETKNGFDRAVDLTPRVVAALASLPQKTGRVFRHRTAREYRATDDSKTVPFGGQIRSAWGTALRKAGIDRHLTPHHARHTWASWHYAVHRDLLRLRDDGCWKTVSQVERYAKLVPPSMAAEIVAFWAVRGATLVHRADDDAASA